MTSKNTKRIYGSRIDIDTSAVKEFFESRGRKSDYANPYVSVCYQDANPELTKLRDAYEKKKIEPLLMLNKKNRLLDVGCGIGRWADAIENCVGYYLGIDISHTLIEKALNRKGNSADFCILSAADISKKKLKVNILFDRVIISGVLLYMNDNDVTRALQGIASVCSQDCLIYLREPLAREERLSLDRYWSEELMSDYSAIYRTQKELQDLLEMWLTPAGFKISIFRELYDDSNLLNRKETSQLYTFLTRGNPKL